MMEAERPHSANMGSECADGFCDFEAGAVTD